jgi:hypothetical protein
MNGEPLKTNNPYDIIENIYSNTTFYAIAYNQFTQCYDTSNILYDSIYPPPSIPLITQHGDTLFATDSIQGNYSYGWFENGIFKTYTDSNYYIPDSTNSYTVELTNEGGCYSISLPYLYTNTGINELISDAIVKVYTNEDNIYINFYNTDFLNGTIELYNIEGQKLQRQTITNTTEILNTQQYAKGIYFVAIIKNDVRKVYKVALL